MMDLRKVIDPMTEGFRVIESKQMDRVKRLIRTLGIVVACLVVQGCNTKFTQPVGAGAATGKKVLLMHYMPWYETPAGRGKWGGHWTGHESEHDPARVDTNGLPDIWSHYHPLIGLYDSSDPALLECHLLQMKLAGIDGVVVDWYGIAKIADHPDIHQATCAMFDATRTFGMSFAACYEDRAIKLMVDWKKISPDQAAAQLSETLRWMQANWFTQPQYFHFNGRPLLLNFGPIFLKDPAVWKAAMDGLPERPALFGLHHLWRMAGGDGGFMWVHHDPWSGSLDPDTITRRIKEVFSYFSTNASEVIVSAYPGYHDVYKQGDKKLDHRNGGTLRETLAVGMAGSWPLIQMVTWNDYGEGTMIEPTHEFGYTFLEIIQQARKKELGEAFRFTAADLRLPACLYALRKGGRVPSWVLDGIARSLTDGDCQKARKELNRLAGR